MIRTIYSCCILFTVLSIITGGLYPLVITFVAHTVFPQQAGGSLQNEKGAVIGSKLIGQTFSNPEYFWSRPSAVVYNAAASSGSNLGPTNPAQLDAVATRAKAIAGARDSPIPVDLVTTSASGLDPHITPAGALYQVPRVARARGIPEDRLRELVAASIEDRTFGILGERRVNVLELNRSLDALGR